MTKKILTGFLALLMLVSTIVFTGSAADTEMPFKDVKKKNWFYDEVLYVYERQLMTGTTNDKFEPNGKLTRAMFVTILGRLAGADEKKTDSFSDVKKSDFYYNAVLWAVKNGVTTGTSSTTFGPAENCTRGQIVTFLHRAVAK